MSRVQKVRWTLFFIFYLGCLQLMSQPQQDPPYINVQGYIPLADKIGHYNYSVQLRGTGKFKAEGQECQVYFYDQGSAWLGDDAGWVRVYNLSADTFIVNIQHASLGTWENPGSYSSDFFIIPYNQDIRIEMGCYTSSLGTAYDYVYYGDQVHSGNNSVNWNTQTVISYTVPHPENITATDGQDRYTKISWDYTSAFDNYAELIGFNIYRNNIYIGSSNEDKTKRDWIDKDYTSDPLNPNPPIPGRLYNYQVSAEFSSWVGETPRSSGDCGFMEPNGNITGKIQTESGYGVDYTRISAIVDDKLNSAMYFDGSDDFINIPYSPDLNPEDEITVEAWVKPDNQIQTDACIYNSSSARLLARAGSENIFIFYINIAGTWHWVYDPTPWSSGNWYHVTGTYDGDSIKLYINGIEKNTQTISGSLDDFDNDVTIGWGSDPVAEHFRGVLDEIRVWKVARNSEDILNNMYTILGDSVIHKELIGYWRFNPSEPSNITGDYSKSSGHHGTVNGAFLETENLPEFLYYDITGEKGDYNISNIYYSHIADTGAMFIVKPDTSGAREFDPSQRKVHLQFSSDQTDYQTAIDPFIDMSSFAIKGKVKFNNLDYFIKDVDIIIDEESYMTTTTDEDGNFITVQQSGEHTIRPSYYDHSFAPEDTTVFVTSAIDNIIFEDTTTHILSGKVGGGKASFDVGEAKLKILGPNSCFTDSVTTESGQYQIRLPAVPDIQVYVSKIDNIPVEDFLFAHEGRLESSKFVSLIHGNDSLDFIYYAKPEVIIEGFPESKTKYNVPVLEQFKKEELTIQIIEDYGGGRICVADSGTMTIHNEITDNFPSIEVPLDSSDNYNFILKAGMPNIISGGLHPHQKRFQVNVATRGGYNTFDQWTIVSGYRPREQTFTTVTPAIPMLILRDPPGDHSYSFLEEGTTTSLTLGMSVLFNEEINTYLQLKAGVAININVGTPFVSIGTGFAQWGLIEDNFTVGASVLGQHEQRLTITNINQYKTSSEETSIGAGSDVYVGAALNIVYAVADVLNVNDIDEIELTKSIVYGVNSEEAFETTYIYTQNHIEQMVIPRLKENLEFATDPDSAQYWSDQIEAWEQIIFLNDSLKQNAEPLTGPGSDISISGGAEKFYSSTITQSTSHAFDFNMYINNEVAWETGLDVAGSGFKFGQRIRTRLNIGSSVSVDTVITNTVGYCIYDNEEIDNFWIKVKSDTTYGTPVFELQQGCYTSHPWEPGTNPHERCILTIDGDYVQTDIDPNDKAVYTLELTNTSPSGQSGSYKLNHIPTSNPDGAQLRIFGDPINDLSPFQLTAYQPTNVPLTVEMGPYAYDYEDLQIELRSVYDEQIADTITFSVHFTPACSQVNIYRPEEGWLVNKASNDSLEIILTDYDKSELSNITLQYSVKDRNDWKDALVISETSLPNNNFSFYWRPKTLKDDEYDLRMKVSWSQADGVTYSKKASGVIDRTAPKTFGKPQPADGILHPGENISIKFNENINKNALSTDNVILRNLKTGVVIPIEIIASDREVIINPTIEDKDIENENLQVSVINIQDQYGNGSGKAVVWSFYVNKNPVYWNTSKITKTAVEGDTCTFWAKLRNNGGENVHFNLSSIPWLDTDINSGWINTGEEKIFRFSMSPDLAAGYYRDTLFAEMSKGNEPLILGIQIQNKPPEWAFDPGAFSNNMTLTAGFYIDDIPFSEENDIVAAFIGDTLCGKVKVQKMVPQDEYVAFLMIHSNSTRGSEVNLVIWDASEGQERSITETLTFIADTSYGLASSPDSLHISGALLQTISLNDNWTWFSLGIEAKNMSTAAILDRLRPRDSDLIKGHTAYAQYLPGTGWIGNLDTLHIGHGFKIKLNISKDLHYIGDKVTDIHWPIEVKSGWNWIGYLPKETLNINSALASLNTTVEDGDQIKNKNSFAIYNATQSIWEGTLEEMKPGEAYMLKVANDGILNYPGLSGKNISLVKILSARALLTTAPDWQVDASVYEYSMNVTGTVTIDGLPVVTENTLLAAFINNECRGITRPVFVKDKWMFFSTIFSTDVTDDSVQFKVYDADNDQIRDVGIKVDYMADKIIGTPTAPFKLWVGIPTGFEKEAEIPKEFALEQNYPNPFNPVTTIRYALKQQEDVKLIIYNMLGQKVKTLVDEPQKAGWYDIRFNAKDLASGVYIYRIKAGKFIKAYKMVIIR